MTGTPFPVEAGHVLAFARSLGTDPDLDSLAVPLTFPIAFSHFDPEWPLRMRPDRPWNGSGTGPGVAGSGGGLHAEQEFEYLRPLRVGETLTAQRRDGKTWTKTGRSGVLNFSERHIDFLDAEGNVVVRTTQVGVRTTPLPDPSSDQEAGA